METKRAYVPRTRARRDVGVARNERGDLELLLISAVPMFRCIDRFVGEITKDASRKSHPCVRGRRFVTQKSYPLGRANKMLTTFENADRQHHRRRERERHIRQMEFMGDGMAITSIADSISGNPLQKIREDPLPIHPKNGCWKSKRTKTIVAFLALIGTTIIGFLVGVGVGERQSAPVVVATSGRSENADPMALRRETISSIVLFWGITSDENLQDESSHAARALDWLVYTDVNTIEIETIRTRFALASLFFATQNHDKGNKWIEDRHWLSSYPVCLWYGVECLDKRLTLGLVQSLNLSSNALTGSIPEEIGLLGLDIRSLDLSGNKLMGTIPESTFMLRNLVNLYLGPNLFMSSIPTHIGQLDRLKQLYLNDCALNGTIPEQIANLSNLEVLDLNSNGLEGSIPARLTELTSLVLLYLDNNRLTGKIPDSIGNLSNLVDLRLRMNLLSGSIPNSIGQLSMLQICYLDTNHLVGSLDGRHLNNLRLLHGLHLYDNKLEGPLPDLGKLELLRVLYLDGNLFTGSIPQSFEFMHRLESVFLFNNKISGPLPSQVGALTNLVEFRAESNGLTGTIPYEFGSLTSLELLYLDENVLTGTIPHVLGLLEDLAYLQLHGNQLTGYMPLKICAMASYNLKKLTADCLSGDEKVSCNCCNRCY